MGIKFKRRTLLYVPGSSQKMVGKSAQIAVDGIIYDLEDSVSPSQKDAARAIVTDQLKSIREGIANTELIVRVNLFSTAFAFDDLAAVCQYRPDSIVVPKATSENILAADHMLSMLEVKYGFVNNSIKIIPLIETALGVEDIYKIVSASGRIVAAQFGAEDFTKDMGIARRADNTEIAYSRNRMAVACKAHNIGCVDTPYTDFQDLAGYEIDTEFVKSIGMTGRAIIHPSLIELTRHIFTPSAQEILEAKEIISGYEKSLRDGVGAFALNGKMIDAPIADRARQILERACE